MQNRSADELSLLIQSLTKAEKRHFILRHRKTRTAGLFDALNNSRSVKDPQLHNLKAILYKQLLSTIRSIPTGKSIEQQLHEAMEDARILFEKKLYKQCYRLLQKVKRISIFYHQISFRFQVLSMEKKMASLENININTVSLQKESSEITAELASINYWSNISMLIYGWHSRNGHILSEKEKTNAESLLPKEAIPPIGFYATLYSLQAKTYHAYIFNNQDYQHLAETWRNHFENTPQMKSIEPLQFEKAKEFLVKKTEQPKDPYRDTPENTVQYFLYAKELFSKELYNEALEYINPIINTRGFYRTDLQIGAMEMQILCHEKLGNDTIIDSLKRSMKRFAKGRELILK